MTAHVPPAASPCQVARSGSFIEPVLLAGGGYVQVTRTTGTGPVLLLLPLLGTEFEAWRPLRKEDLLLPETMFENSYELLFHSAGFARREWRHATPWNVPTSARIAAGARRTYGVRLVLAPSPRTVEHTLLQAGHPVAVPLPGPVIPLDATNATLLLRSPITGRGISTHSMLPTLTSHPAGALTVDLLVAEPPPLAEAQGSSATRSARAFRPRTAVSDSPCSGPLRRGRPPLQRTTTTPTARWTPGREVGADCVW